MQIFYEWFCLKKTQRWEFFISNVSFKKSFIKANNTLTTDFYLFPKFIFMKSIGTKNRFNGQ